MSLGKGLSPWGVVVSACRTELRAGAKTVALASGALLLGWSAVLANEVPSSLASPASSGLISGTVSSTASSEASTFCASNTHTS